MGDAMDKEPHCKTCLHYEQPWSNTPCCVCDYGKYKIDINSLTRPTDIVNHPPHYTDHPSGIECIQITEHMNFCLGNAVKYLWRAGLKGDAVEDMEKAIWYINREIERRKAYGDDDTAA